MEVGRFFAAFGVSASGLSAQRQRMNTIAKNIANIDTTRTQAGGVYKRQMVVLEGTDDRKGFRGLLNEDGLRLSRTHTVHLPTRARTAFRRISAADGVRVKGTFTDETSPKRVFDPGHPDADEAGYVEFPNIEVISEMIDMMLASRVYEANVTAISAAKSMIKKALEI